MNSTEIKPGADYVEYITRHNGQFGFNAPVMEGWIDSRNSTRQSFNWKYEAVYRVEYTTFYGRFVSMFRMVGNPTNPPYWNAEQYETATTDELDNYSLERCKQWFEDMRNVIIERVE